MTRLLARILAWTLLAACVAPVLAAETVPITAKPSDVLNMVRKRGELVVGIKSDYPPFGMTSAQGALQGFEADMARDLSRQLGVGLRLVSVTSANRLQKLEEGAVDLVIATLGDTAERRRIATVVEPNYYASGVTVFMRPESRITQWQEIRGQTVCAVQGSYFNRSMSQRYLLNLQIYNNSRDAKLAVRDGRCIGLLFDNTAIWADLQRPEWAGYKAPLPPAMLVNWSLALARKEAGSEFEYFVGDAVARWHRSGFLVELEKAWGLPPSGFLAEAHALWQRTAADGRPFCERDAGGAWTAACRNRVLLTPQDVGGLQQLGLAVRQFTGWDLTFVYDDFDRARFLRGLGQTVLLMLACICGSLLLGLAGALLAQSRFRLLAPAARALAVYGRMTPPLLQMYLLFFGIGALAWNFYGISLPAWSVAVWCLSYYTGSSVMTAMLDSCDVLREQQPDFRLTARTLLVAYEGAAGSITASLVNVCKATMMASVIAVPELLSAATGILADSGNVAEMMNMLLLSFLVLIAITVRLLQRIERRVRRLAQDRS